MVAAHRALADDRTGQRDAGVDNHAPSNDAKGKAMLLVLGSVNADLLFKVKTLPAPGETVLCPSYEMAPGGKGSNQAAAAAKAGGDVSFIGHLGNDGHAPELRRILAAAGMKIDGLATSPNPTAIAVIGIDENGENAIIVASGANLDTSHEQIADERLYPGVTVLCQNEIRPEETFRILERASAHGARTILNLAPACRVPAPTLDSIDVLVVNEIEARMVAGDNDTPLEELARRLATTHHLTCVVTLGSAGAMALTAGGGLKVGALRINPVDTTGAGDTFVGVLAACLDEGMSLDAALHRAAVAGALSCEAVGAQSAQPLRTAIEARLGELAPPTPM
ncbi:MAG: ribokinase [Geminicoccaceae bacterium]|nr:ribokinase [Geminicoccaceae bacterium]